MQLCVQCISTFQCIYHNTSGSRFCAYIRKYTSFLEPDVRVQQEYAAMRTTYMQLQSGARLYVLLYTPVIPDAMNICKYRSFLELNVKSPGRICSYAYKSYARVKCGTRLHNSSVYTSGNRCCAYIRKYTSFLERNIKCQCPMYMNGYNLESDSTRLHILVYTPVITSIQAFWSATSNVTI